MDNPFEKYQFLEIDTDTFSDVRRDWEETLNLLAGNIEPSRYYRVLDQLESYAQGRQQHDLSVHAVMLDGRAECVMHISDVHKGTEHHRIKVLNIMPHPRLDFDAVDEITSQHMNEFSLVASAAISKSLDYAIDTESAKEIKLFGRSNDMASYFNMIATKINEHNPSLAVTAHGNWIVFKV